MGALQPWHLIVILVIVLMVFGPGKLPELGKSIGEGLRELKKATDGTETATVSPTAQATVSPEQPATAFACPQCHSPATPGNKFCGACGSALATPVTSINT